MSTLAFANLILRYFVQCILEGIQGLRDILVKPIPRSGWMNFSTYHGTAQSLQLNTANLHGDMHHQSYNHIVVYNVACNDADIGAPREREGER